MSKMLSLRFLITCKFSMQLHQNIFFPGKLFKYEKTFQKTFAFALYVKMCL